MPTDLPPRPVTVKRKIDWGTWIDIFVLIAALVLYALADTTEDYLSLLCLIGINVLIVLFRIRDALLAGLRR